MLVPEDRADPDSRLIRLAVLRVSAANPEPGRATVHLAGGPGGSAIQFLYHEDSANDDLLAFAEYAELILLDQRGTGYSEPSVCTGIRVAVPSEAAEARFREAMRQCLDDATRRGISLDALSTWHAALDVRDVRRALGYQRWNLWGVSYGTRLAEAVMDVDAEGVRAVLLDSTSPPVFPTSLAHGFRSSLDAVGRACDAQRRCARDIGDLDGRLVDAIASYGADPLTLDGLDERLWPEGRLTINADVVAAFLYDALYSSSNYDDLPSLLAILEQRNEPVLRTMALGIGADTRSTWGTGMALVTICRWDPPSPASLEAWRLEEPQLDQWVLSPMFGRNALERCRELYRIDPDPSVTPLASDIPTLMLSGLADPITPPSFREAVEPGLTQATVIEVPYTGHYVIAHLNAYAPGCGTALMEAFFAAPGAPVELPCAEAVHPPDFVTRLRQTEKLSTFVLGLLEGNRPILPPIASFAILWAFFAYPTAAIGRRIDGRRESHAALTRLLSWGGAALSLGGVVVAASIVYRMANFHQMSLFAGWLPSVAWAGWLAFAGAGLSLASTILRFRTRHPSERRIGTTVGIVTTAASSVLSFTFLVSVGAGPW